MAPRAVSRNLFAAPFRSIFEHRRLIAAFVRQDIRSRYVASVMGLSWTIVQPLALLALYTFVFSSILRLRYGENGTTANFSAYLFCGLLPWFAFSESLSRSASVVIANTNLIKRVIFPSDILPVYVVVSG
ncbi:MAG: ABC transporter permease, partial [Vicinamibacteria bacterium]